jgi:hypothetical protein
MRSVPLLYNEDQLDPASLEAQPLTNIKSTQALNVNSSSLKYILIVVATLFQHDRAQWVRVRRRQNEGCHKIYIKMDTRDIRVHKSLKVVAFKANGIAR